MSETTTAGSNIMDRLRTETQSLHDAAESHAHQAAMVKGELPVERYVAHIAQHYLVHRALEAELRAKRETHPAFAAAITEEQYQEPYAAEDLRHFGLDPESVEATPGTSSLIGQIRESASSDPIRLLGYHYVLEGSNNGNRFIAMKLRGVYGLDDGKGLKYLDPYGDRQREVWMGFKSAMSGQSFTAQEQDAMVEAAKGMFEGIAAISSDLASGN